MPKIVYPSGRINLHGMKACKDRRTGIVHVFHPAAQIRMCDGSSAIRGTEIREKDIDASFLCPDCVEAMESATHLSMPRITTVISS